MEPPTATSLVDRIRYALASPMASDDILDPHKELAEVLKTVGLEPSSSGGTIIFHGKDPILKSPWPLATMASVGLMAKAVAGAGILLLRTRKRDELSMSVRPAPAQCPSVY